METTTRIHLHAVEADEPLVHVRKYTDPTIKPDLCLGNMVTIDFDSTGLDTLECIIGLGQRIIDAAAKLKAEQTPDLKPDPFMPVSQA
jgi:hypothetical protein